MCGVILFSEFRLFCWRAFTNLATPRFAVACLPGLESLRELDELNIEMQLVDCCSCEPFPTYNVKNNLDQTIFSISPVNSHCTYYDMQLSDNFGNPVVLFQRCYECKCCAGVKIEVIHSLGTLIGTVQVEVAFLNPSVFVRDANDETIFKVKRTVIEFFPKTVDFSINSADESVEIGKMTWIWPGWMSRQRHYKIVFPRDLVTEMKVTLLATWYLIESVSHAKRRNRAN
ncbi:phospholipid scramblase 2-like isoform X1 [Zophobas morio]|uniref:phospholipid scramblase 2-like isoform X1 n=1 Tax=Zophobas morio TaxID=2755281 RepID=UPI00308358F7